MLTNNSLQFHVESARNLQAKFDNTFNSQPFITQPALVAGFVFSQPVGMSGNKLNELPFSFRNILETSVTR